MLRHMRCGTRPIVPSIALASALSLLGCSAPTDEAGGTAGAPSASGRGGTVSATAGAGSTAGSGASATGGTPGSAGTPSGGASGASGASAGAGGATGGAAGAASGGSAGAGGTASAGGVSGTGGSGGSGGDGGGGGGGSAGTGGGATTCPPATPLTGGKQYCSNSKGSAGGGYAYELWAEGSGTGCMNVRGKDATFGANWNNVEDFLARIGLDFDQTKGVTEIGTLSADFAETKTGGTDGLVYVGIYGWTLNPLREYYILEDWGTTKPAGTASDGTPRTSVGTIVVDGETYDVWKKTRTNKPAITGKNETFDQYFSIRRTPRQCGHISISEHFTKWMALGLDLGKLYEAKLLLEAQDTSGTIEFTTATVVVKK